VDRIARLQALGRQRLRVLDCLGGDSRFGPGYFEPAPDVDIFDAFRAYVARMTEVWAAESHPLSLSLPAAGRLLTGDLTAADVILDHLPAEPYKLDHGAGICWVTPQYALNAALPLPADLTDTDRWLAGSPEQAALRRWLAGHRDQLQWIEADGVYSLAPTDPSGQSPH